MTITDTSHSTFDILITLTFNFNFNMNFNINFNSQIIFYKFYVCVLDNSTSTATLYLNNLCVFLLLLMTKKLSKTYLLN